MFKIKKHKSEFITILISINLPNCWLGDAKKIYLLLVSIKMNETFMKEYRSLLKRDSKSQDSIQGTAAGGEVFVNG
jgi:hypothetical protein